MSFFGMYECFIRQLERWVKSHNWVYFFRWNTIGTWYCVQKSNSNDEKTIQKSHPLNILQCSGFIYMLADIRIRI